MTLTFLFIAFTAIVALAGCGGGTTAGTGDSAEATSGTTASAGQQSAAPSTTSTEPVTLKIFNSVKSDDASWQALIVDPIRKKFPQVTVERINVAKGSDYPDFVASGSVPDIFFTSFNSMPVIQDLKLLAPLDDLVKKYNVPIDKLEQTSLKSIRYISNNGELNALPIYLNVRLMTYNKDIFDKYGVAYPKDGLTWDDAVALAKKLTRSESGVQYTGLYPGSWSTLSDELGAQPIDPKTLKAQLDSPAFKRLADLYQQVYDIPGAKYYSPAQANDAFGKDKNLAMLPNWLNGLINQKSGYGSEMKWDITSQPVFDKNGKNSRVDFHMMMISPTTKYKDLAFQIIAYLTTSPEAQELVARASRLPALSDSAVRKHFADNDKSFQAKHLDPVFDYNPAPSPIPTIYDAEANKALNPAMDKIGNKQTDVNTALREAQEAATKGIATLQSK
jgi:multiple sugar transport system substrate-binding protein